MKDKETGVIIKRSPETERLEIAGKHGHIMDRDILGNVYVFVPGYSKSFVLRPDEVRVDNEPEM